MVFDVLFNYWYLIAVGGCLWLGVYWLLRGNQKAIRAESGETESRKANFWFILTIMVLILWLISTL